MSSKYIYCNIRSQNLNYVYSSRSIRTYESQQSNTIIYPIPRFLSIFGRKRNFISKNISVFFYHNHANQVGFIGDRVYFHKYKRITSVFVIWRSGIAIKRTKLSDSTSIFEFEGNLFNPLILGYFIIVIYIYI